MIKSLRLCGAVEHNMEVTLHIDVIQDGIKLKDVQQMRIEINIVSSARADCTEDQSIRDSSPSNGSLSSKVSLAPVERESNSSHHAYGKSEPGRMGNLFSCSDTNMCLTGDKGNLLPLNNANLTGNIFVTNSGNTLVYSYYKQGCVPAHQEFYQPPFLTPNNPTNSNALNSSAATEVTVKKEAFEETEIEADCEFNEESDSDHFVNNDNMGTDRNCMYPPPEAPHHDSDHIIMITDRHCDTNEEIAFQEVDKKIDPHQILRCFLCQETFLQADALLLHLKGHHDSSKYLVEQSSTQDSENDPVRYQKSHIGRPPHSDEQSANLFQEDVNNFVHPNSAIESITAAPSVESPQNENQLQKVCSICNKTFRTNNNLKRHMRIHTGEKPHVCIVCDRGFAQKSALIIHSRTHSGELPYVCSGCGKRFAQKSALNVHLKRAPEKTSPMECTICREQIQGCQAMIDHRMMHSGGLPLPDDWSADLDTEDKLKAKIGDIESMEKAKKEAIEESRKCTTCGRHFSRTRDMQRHMRTHTGEKPYECPECDKRFSEQSALKVHMRSHTGDKPFACDICGRRFSQKSSVSVHKRVHTGEKPFQCDLCGKHFSQAGSLKDHVRTHTGEKTHVCTICNKAFADRKVLKAHIRTHTGETYRVCEICGKGFTLAPSYRVHMRTHTGEKPYKCDYCDKRFSQFCSKVRHMLIHTGDKPFSCEICGKKFNDSSILARHRRVHLK